MKTKNVSFLAAILMTAVLLSGCANVGIRRSETESANGKTKSRETNIFAHLLGNGPSANTEPKYPHPYYYQQREAKVETIKVGKDTIIILK